MNLETINKPRPILPLLGEYEYFTDIAGYEGVYEVSSFGRIRSVKRLAKTKNGYRTLKSQLIAKTVNRFGYNIVSLWKNGESKNKKVSRLVCTAWHPNPEKKKQVNHIDTVKTNDYYRNLEWSTNKENHDHAVDTGLRKSCIPVIVYNSKTKELVGQFNSIKRASIGVKLSTNSVWLLLDKHKANRKGLMFFTEPVWQQFKTENNL
jgi:hypothetical protein